MPPRKPSAVGAHVPVGGGLTKGLDYAAEIGARAVQVFVSNPRGWAPSAGDPAQDEAFRGRCADDGVPSFVHAPYLVNFGSPTPATLTKSVDAVQHALSRAAAIGARGVVVHAGSAVAGAHRDEAMAQLRAHLLPLLDALEPDGPRLLVEPTAGGGQALAATVQDLGPWFAQLDDHPMLGVCLDTCHAFAAGHDLAAPGGMKKTLDALVKTVGRGRLQLVHANDSKDPLGSGRDRHEVDRAGADRQGPVLRAVPPPRHPGRAGRARDAGGRRLAPPRRRPALRAARRLTGRRHPRQALRSLLVGVPLLAPRVRPVVVAALLPEAPAVGVEVLDPARPLRALPGVQVGHDQAQREAVLGRQRLAVAVRDEQGGLAGEVLPASCWRCSRTPPRPARA